jgi:heat-inducible transcriptional repressor
MNQRQENLFLNILHEYINSAEPVGSRFLVNKYKLEVSPATIRNDMAVLEQEGLITHPHTSAGRIPTEKGYKYFIENFLKSHQALAKKDEQTLERIKKETKNLSDEMRIKNIAKEMAALTNSAIVVGFAKNDVYYTGISNLFSQPEFANFDVIYNISGVVDHLDEVVADIFDSVRETQVKIGKDNYFADNCASILTKANNKLFGLLGPMRMDYARNLGLVDYAKKLLV